ncbi:15-hydroxyprostaglandin dehydrogenase [Rhypophila decipiens]|uniref:15-hydroxyprostaglandin dehydrogenase n=1 Tax=Rhypophila decipiens TaxID=261697 RepID=A0AAN6YCY5_9PEZI|nr:15-hydroxyprostaglandin dehydrogenase [Rhypophila decipiens]
MKSESKSIIITGGASGIGLAMARYFASQGKGHRICILDIDPLGEKIAAEIEAEFSNVSPSSSHPGGSDRVHVTLKKCDVSSWEDQARVFKEVFGEQGRVDIVMANAGVSEQGMSTMVDLNDDDDDYGEPSKPKLKVLEVNLLGVVYSVKLATHYMKKKKPRLPGTQDDESLGRGGSIICTASNAGLYPFPIAPLYAASKAGVINLVRSLAKPLAGLDIRINALAPATVETNIAGPDKTLFQHMVITPMTTLIRGVEEILSSDETITGQVAEIHGDKVTFRPHHEYVDEDSKENLLVFERLGYA